MNKWHFCIFPISLTFSLVFSAVLFYILNITLSWKFLFGVVGQIMILPTTAEGLC